MDMIKVKQLVKIKCADGRVKRGMVTAIDQARKSVTVQYSENGDIWTMKVKLEDVEYQATEFQTNL